MTFKFFLLKLIYHFYKIYNPS